MGEGELKVGIALERQPKGMCFLGICTCADDGELYLGVHLLKISIFFGRLRRY
jgi:hypothetical protein